MMNGKLLGVRLQVLNPDGRQMDVTDLASARVLLNHHLRHDPLPLLPAPLNDIAMDTKKIKTFLRTLWKHEGFAWGNSSHYYDFMNVSFPIESFSSQTRHVLRKEKEKSIKLSSIITTMEDPSKKPKLTKNYQNLSIREIHILIIEALMKVNKRNPESYHDDSKLMDEFNSSWSVEEKMREDLSNDDLQISPGAPTNRDTALLDSPAFPAASIPSLDKVREVLASPVSRPLSPITPLNKAALVTPLYYTTGKVGAMGGGGGGKFFFIKFFFFFFKIFFFF